MHAKPFHLSPAFLLVMACLGWSAALPPKTGKFRDRFQAFRQSLDTPRHLSRAKDSLHYVLGELDYLSEAYDTALAIHLAIPLPASGAFRDSVLAQRSRIFAKLWPMSDRSDEEETEAQGPTFEWGIGSGHTRSFYQAGPDFPYGRHGTGYHVRSWLLESRAGLTLPFSIRGNDGSLAAHANLSPSRQYLDYDLGLRADLLDVFRENLSLSGSMGLSKVTEGEYLATLSVSSSRLWLSEKGSFGVQGGYYGGWDGTGRRIDESFQLGCMREVYLEGDNGLTFNLDGAIRRLDGHAYRYEAPVLYVDDVARTRPTHFRGPDFRDTLAGAGPDDLELYTAHAGALPLSLHAPQTSFSVTPSILYERSLAKGWYSYIGARYGMDLYPEYAWDQAPGPDALDPFSGDFNGLALNRADGRHYAAALVEDEDGIREFFGSEPLERRQGRRVDQRAGLDFTLARYFKGQAFSLGASAEWTWSNLPGSSPAESRPWQWGLTLDWTRTWDLPFSD